MKMMKNIGLQKIKLINYRVHNYLDSLEEIGKVLSFSSIIEVATKLNNNKPLGTLEMGVLYSKIPESIKTEILIHIFQLKILKQE